MNSEKLIAMARQISLNQASSSPQEAAIELAAHINKFWALSMRTEFVNSLDASEIDFADRAILLQKIRH